MKKYISAILLLGIIIVFSCKVDSRKEVKAVEIWKLGWRMVENNWKEKYEIAENQFDSLLNTNNEIDVKFILTGLEVLNKLEKQDKIKEVFDTQSDGIKREVCQKKLMKESVSCMEIEVEKVVNKKLELELIYMTVNDQAARGNILEDLISEYKLDESRITEESAIFVDERNRNSLKRIFKEFGFPTRTLVGREAMDGVFWIIQHADGDKIWQKNQLIKVERAVKKGDIDGDKFAYLYDRIKINSGEKQLYGTQFANVDPVKRITKLAEIEDVANLDQRRRTVGLMPIEVYKRFVLRRF